MKKKRTITNCQTKKTTNPNVSKRHVKYLKKPSMIQFNTRDLIIMSHFTPYYGLDNNLKKKTRKVIDTFSLIHYDLHLYNLHSIQLNKNMH